MTNGKSYQLTASAEEVFKAVTHSDGKLLDHIHSFKTAHGEKVYLNSSHIVSIISYEGISEEYKEDSKKEEKNEERKQNNLEAAHKFKEELKDNME
jgi:tRNA C32,U32 (ribose-2'-O)-methylase TrmJ